MTPWTPEQKERLKELAGKASQGDRKHIPGDSYCAHPHVVCGGKTFVFEDHHDDGCRENFHDEGYPGSEADAAFIAAVNPSIILTLLSDLEAVTRERDEALSIKRAHGETIIRLQQAYLPGNWEKLKEIKDENARLRAMVRRLAYAPIDPNCLVCGEHTVRGHSKDCFVGQALAGEK